MPSGGPTYAFLNMMENNTTIENFNLEYESVSGPDLLVAAITSKSNEIVVAPTNVGAKLYNANSGYVFAGTVSFGNLYLVSKENKTMADLENAKILVFGQNSTPDIILRKILQHNNLLDKVTIEYVLDVNDARLAFVNGNYEFVLLAEPVLSLTKKNSTVHVVLDLQEEYKKMTGLNYYPQAGVFIENTFFDRHEAFVKSFLVKLEESIDFVNEQKELAADYYINNETLKPTLPKDVIISSIPNSNVNFLDAQESKALLNDYLNLLLQFNGNTIGNKLPNDDFYLEISE
jgi:NitT/TauT family transport system substrate-binding protein